MYQRPGRSDRQKSEREMRSEIAVGRTFVGPEEESDRKQSSAGRDNDKEKNERTAEVLALGAETEPFARRGENGKPRQQQNRSGEDVPAREQLGAEQRLTSQQNKNRERKPSRNADPMPGVEA